MPLTEAQLKARRKYDTENMTYRTVKIRKELDAAFREAVTKNGDTMNGVLTQAIRDYIASHK